MAAINLPEHNLTFVHVPKSAGSSVVEWLLQNFSDAVRVSGHPSLPMIKEMWDVKRSFAIVRNPWARIVSAYFYVKQYGYYWKENNVTTIDEFPSWDHFVETLSYNTNSWNTLGTNQTKWIEGGVDYLLRAETLDKDFVVIQELLNCYKPLPYINTSEHLDYRSYYKPHQIDLISKVFAEDIETFNYTFDQ